MKHKFRNAGYPHRHLDIDDLTGGHGEPHIVSIGVIGVLRVPNDEKMLGETLFIDEHKHRYIYKYGGVSSVSTVGCRIDQELGGSVRDYVLNAELIGPWLVHACTSNVCVDRHPN